MCNGHIELVLPDAAWEEVAAMIRSIYHSDEQSVFRRFTKHGGNSRLMFRYTEQEAEVKLKNSLAKMSLPQLNQALQRLPSSAVRFLSF